MVQHVVQVAPVGDNLDALFVGIREFPTKKIVLLAPTEKMADAKALEERLKPFRVPVTIIQLKGNMIETMFDVLASLKKSEGNDDAIVVNVATGDRMSTCAALSASYVNGVKAFSVVDDKIMALPFLKFSFSKIIAEKKLEILKALSEGPLSFEELSKRVKVSSPLLSYHLNGDRETEGLIEIGLVEYQEEEKGKKISLSSMGRLFFKGYCQ
ncbi:MAG: winged helix-turn-helix transcriptional regulator [Nitrososphaerota archaeon]|nr:winged helix-turn-helix transcriptional regulator [Nitrososphaerota archaeon]